MTGKEIDELEDQIPHLAGVAFKKAFQEAYDAGFDIMIVRDDALYIINNQGKNEFVKHIPKKIHVEKRVYRI
jgi:pantothenate kinase